MENSVPQNATYYANVQRGQIVTGHCSPGHYAVGGSACNLRGRGCVAEFTTSSRKRLRRYLRNSTADYKVFVTLTYPPGSGSDPVRAKRDLEVFCKRYARIRPSAKWSTCWFVEYQANGRIHYHIYGTQYIHHALVARWWYDIVGSGSPDHLSAGTQVVKLRGGRRGQIRYAAKYATKVEQKEAPAGAPPTGRYWGVKGLKSTVEAATTFRAYQKDNPSVYEALDSLHIALQSGLQSQKIRLLFVKSETGYMRCYVFDLEDEETRLIHAELINEINERLNYEYRLQR